MNDEGAKGRRTPRLQPIRDKLANYGNRCAAAAHGHLLAYHWSVPV